MLSPQTGRLTVSTTRGQCLSLYHPEMVKCRQEPPWAAGCSEAQQGLLYKVTTDTERPFFPKQVRAVFLSPCAIICPPPLFIHPPPNGPIQGHEDHGCTRCCLCVCVAL